MLSFFYENFCERRGTGRKHKPFIDVTIVLCITLRYVEGLFEYLLILFLNYNEKISIEKYRRYNNRGDI